MLKTAGQKIANVQPSTWEKIAGGALGVVATIPLFLPFMAKGGAAAGTDPNGMALPFGFPPETMSFASSFSLCGFCVLCCLFVLVLLMGSGGHGGGSVNN